jgi:hypothetical protein
MAGGLTTMPIGEHFEAEVFEVIPPDCTWAIVRYRMPDGSKGSVQVMMDDYDIRYWPPARGDIIRVQLQAVEVVARPRAVAKGDG